MDLDRANLTVHFIVRPGGIGDSLLLAPCLAALRNRGGCKIILLGYPSRLSLLHKAGLADAVFALDLWLADPVQVFRSALGDSNTPGDGKGEVLIGDNIRIDSFFPTLPDSLPKTIMKRIHRPFPEEASSIHAVEYFADCLSVTLPLSRKSPLANLAVKRNRDRERRLWLHPGAGGEEKCWPLPFYLNLGSSIKTQGDLRVCFLLGEAEMNFQDSISAQGFEVLHPHSLEDLASALGPRDLYVGNDTGPTHLAALMGLETLAIFGPTNPEVWGPWGRTVHTFTSEEPGSWPDPSDVLVQIQGLTARSRNHE